MAFVIAQPCVDVMDKSCMEQCPVDCIYPGAKQMFIQPDECVDCGACEMACPVEAVFHIEDVPAEWEAWTALNRDHFADLVKPGGAAKLAKATDAG